jgi:DNA repair exonuclease SbcCD ATPase subunit
MNFYEQFIESISRRKDKLSIISLTASQEYVDEIVDRLEDAKRMTKEIEENILDEKDVYHNKLKDSLMSLQNYMVELSERIKDMHDSCSSEEYRQELEEQWPSVLEIINEDVMIMKSRLEIFKEGIEKTPNIIEL